MSTERPTVAAEVRARLRELAPEGISQEERSAAYEALRARLDAVPSSQRWRNWRQTSVLLDVSFRQRPERVLRQLRQLRASMTANGRLEKFEAFYTGVQELLGDLTVTPHGFSPSLQTVDHDALWSRVAALGNHLTTMGNEWFVTSGTLLGLVREGGVVPHDDDVDLCVLVDAEDERSAAREWLKTRWELRDILRPQRLHRVAKVDSTGSPTIDLFPAWIAGDRLYAWPWCYGDVDAEAVLPLRTLRVGGRDLSLPREPPALLTVNYGPSWRVPDPLFLYDWKGAKDRFATFVDELEQS